VTASGDRTKLPAGSVADVRIIAKVDPTSDVATAMAVDYALGTALNPIRRFMAFSALIFFVCSFFCIFFVFFVV
jgi:hypothetical protein